MKAFLRFVKDVSGYTAIEHGLITALILTAVIAGAKLIYGIQPNLP